MPLLAASGISVVRDGSTVLDDVSLAVEPGEHWALLGPNGAGKSTLLSVLGAWRFPTSGSVSVLGATLGRTDLRELRRSIGWVNPSLSVRPAMAALDVVLTGATATTDLLRRDIPAAERGRARELLALLGLAGFDTRAFGTLSAGERGRALIARALLPSPALLLLDEPFTGLDLPGREGLRPRLKELAEAQPDLASVLVTHHLEELPASTTHAALLRNGRLLATGPITEVLTPRALSDCFGLPLDVDHRNGRWLALGV